MGSFTVGQWLIVAIIVYVLVRAGSSVLGLSRGRADTVCTVCGHHGRAVVRTRGSIWIELVLWLCLIVPGLVYSLWRLTTRHNACAACDSAAIVPDTSPIGRKLLREHAAAPPPDA